MENEQVFTDKDIIINEYGVFMNDDALERFKNSQEYQNVRRKVIDFLIEQKRYFGADIDSFRSMSSTSLDVDMEDRHKPLLKDLASPYLTGNNRLWLQSQLTELEKQLRETYKEIIVSNDIKQEDIVAELKKREGTERAVSFDIHSEIKIIDNVFQVLSDDRIRASADYKSFKESIEKKIKAKEISKKSLPEKIKEYDASISKKLDGTNTNLKEAAYLAGLDYINRLVYKDIYKGIELKEEKLRGKPLARFTRKVAEAIGEAFDKVKGKGKEILEQYYDARIAAENNRSERNKDRAAEKQAEQRRKAEEQQRKEQAKQKAQQRKAKEKQAEQRRKEQAKQDAQERKEEQKQEEQKRKKREKSLKELEKEERQKEREIKSTVPKRNKITNDIKAITAKITDEDLKSKIKHLRKLIDKSDIEELIDQARVSIEQKLGHETTIRLENLLRDRKYIDDKRLKLNQELQAIRNQKYKMRNLIDGGLSY